VKQPGIAEDSLAAARCCLLNLKPLGAIQRLDDALQALEAASSPPPGLDALICERERILSCHFEQDHMGLPLARFYNEDTPDE